jgi:hypothetical protein
MQLVAVLERRPHQTDSRGDDQSDLALPRRHIRVTGYCPPSKWITESADRKSRFTDEMQSRRERPFREDYTFQPQINPKWQSVMDSRSKQLTESVATDLFKESLDHQERQRKGAEEVKQW